MSRSWSSELVANAVNASASAGGVDVLVPGGQSFPPQVMGWPVSELAFLACALHEVHLVQGPVTTVGDPMTPSGGVVEFRFNV
jgi:hypothetical protein